jgi:hypothetical protein
MAGSPLKRQRKAGIRADDGSVIAFPYMPRVADLPRGWRHWSPAQKIEHLLGMTLDDMAEILSWPIAELDPFRRHCQLKQGWYPPAVGGAAVRCREALGTPIGLPPLKRKGPRKVDSTELS